jgi:hypothetical protein
LEQWISKKRLGQYKAEAQNSTGWKDLTNNEQQEDNDIL